MSDVKEAQLIRKLEIHKVKHKWFFGMLKKKRSG